LERKIDASADLLETELMDEHAAEEKYELEHLRTAPLPFHDLRPQAIVGERRRIQRCEALEDCGDPRLLSSEQPPGEHGAAGESREIRKARDKGPQRRSRRRRLVNRIDRAGVADRALHGGEWRARDLRDAAHLRQVEIQPAAKRLDERAELVVRRDQ